MVETQTDRQFIYDLSDLMKVNGGRLRYIIYSPYDSSIEQLTRMPKQSQYSMLDDFAMCITYPILS